MLLLDYSAIAIPLIANLLDISGLFCPVLGG